ncbi:MAG: tetratricopeptide repeat protein, partial [Myxococcales bacterium]|nr:tetratricopeptide repeat protein [Myxococcales bacterium]
RQLSKGDHTAAMASYQRLVERFPASAEAKAARVSLGRLELRRGRAKQALAHFDAYLASAAGELAEEARYGRIRALRALGRHAQELASIEAFLAEYGDGMYAARLRKRAEELRQ